MNFETIWRVYPELFLKPYRQALPAKTLSQLGIKSLQDASKAGLTCIRPASVAGQRSAPSLWTHAKDQAVIAEYILEIKDARKLSAVESRQRQVTRREKELESNQAEAVGELARITGWAPDTVRNALAPALLAELAVHPQDPEQQLVLKGVPPWRERRVDTKKLTFQAEGFALSATTPALCRALLAGDAVAYALELDRALLAKHQEVENLLVQWAPSRPEWFSPSALQRWALGAVNGKQVEHPLWQVSEVRQLGERTTSVEVLGKYVQGRVASAPVVARLWATDALEGGTVKTHLDRLLKEFLSAEVHEELAQFLQANPVTEEVRRNEFSIPEWGKFLAKAFAQALPVKFAPGRAALAAQAQVSKLLARRHLELAAKRCRRELPASLKDFYPLARSMQREVTFYYGPTNSGKTHQALEHLKSANSGAYLGPLRLLALEVFERLNAAQVPTSLVTGEMVHETPRAQHTAATIEMLNLGKPVEVAVVDEVQMLADKDRGSAWLQAVLGAPAQHLILLGSASALPAVRMLAKVTGERLNEVKLERLNPLKTTNTPMSLRDAPKGSALIVFSRQAALSLADCMRAKHGRTVSVVYGALSPEVRSEQARQFREGETDILVSTDAIGMGLNLPIHTVVFTTVTKWNGEAEVLLEHSLTCQIAGRAGRFGLQEAGFVTTTQPNDLKYVRKMLEKPLEPLAPPYSAGLNLEMADSISRHLETNSLSQVIAFFVESMAMESWATPRCSEEQQLLAGYLDQFQLSLKHKLVLSNAPAVDKGIQNPNFKEMVACIQNDAPENLPMLSDGARKLSLEAMEGAVKSVTLYSWMHYRFPELFPRISQAQELLSKLNDAITQALAGASSRSCTQCGKPVPWDHAFGKCENCFKARRR